MCDMLSQVRDLYQAYIQTAEQLEADRGLGDGLLGFGKKPADDPCHTKFAGDLDHLLADFAAETPDSRSVRPVLEFIYNAPQEHRQPLSIYWMLIAVQGTTPPLIARLSPEDAAALQRQYGRDVPRWERLPIQKEIFRLLKQQAKS